MNAQHQISRKINRFKRLTAKLKIAPTDGAKAQRKQELAYELGKLGIKL